MAGPLDVEVVAVVEGELDVLALELVDDGAVVDAVDGNLAAGMFVEEAVALFAQPGNVDGGNVELVLVDVEVGAGLLLVGVDLDEHYVLGVVVADDDLAEELPVAFVVEAAEMNLQAPVEVVGFDVLVREDILITEDRREGLQSRPAWD